LNRLSWWDSGRKSEMTVLRSRRKLSRTMKKMAVLPFQLSQPGTFTDPLTEVLRTGARALLAQALEAVFDPVAHAKTRPGALGRRLKRW
jgi:hypothetical protein